MAQETKATGLSPERVERIKATQHRRAKVDPSCLALTPEEFINWHPVGGISWEERSRRMKEAGITDDEDELINTPVKELAEVSV